MPYPKCVKCLAHALETIGLEEAFASTAIESGKTSTEIANNYFSTYHKLGHPTQDEFDAAIKRIQEGE